MARTKLTSAQLNTTLDAQVSTTSLGTTLGTIFTSNVTVPTGKNVKISITTVFNASTTSASLSITVKRDGVAIWQSNYPAPNTAGYTQTCNPLVLDIGVSAGAHTYTVVLANAAGACSHVANSGDANFLLVEPC